MNTSNLLATIHTYLEQPSDTCPMCDSGRLRNPAKDHWSDCRYLLARNALVELELDAARLAEYNSGSEDCAICHQATQNGVWGCDACWDGIKAVCGEYLRLRQRAAFDQAHGLTSQCPGYVRSDYGKAPTCKYCGLPPEAHGPASQAGAVGQP